MFETTDAAVIDLAETLWKRIIKDKRLDLTLYSPASRQINADTIRHSNVREIGSEWICHQILEELGISQVLAEAGFTEEQIRLGVTQIVSRAVYPASELKTASWIKENSAIGELTGYDCEKITKDRLYESALRLYAVKDRLDRARQRYPSVQYYYDIEVTLSEDNRTATVVSWSKNEQQYAKKEASLGLYFLRTSLLMEDEVMIWNIYNTIREIESSFRTLKTDLDLRPVYHKSDAGTMAHLHLGLLAYWVVNTVRCKLKAHGINSHWQEIIRIGSTQKIITTRGTNTAGVVIGVSKCSEPGGQLRNIQSILLIKPKPFAKRKSVVHKPELKKNETQYLLASPPI